MDDRVTDEFLNRLRQALAPEFSVDRLLGQGGMGIVLLAREVSLGKRVAIKTIRPELATAVMIERFRREAKTLAGLSHPNIVPVHRLLTRDGLPFLVMEYLEGETLSQRIERGPLPPADVVGIGKDVLTALEELHRRGVVHRDIKPSNVLFWSDRAVVADFGVAKSVVHSSDPPITKKNEIVGTEAYMAPEVLGGVDATVASDLYAAGMVLFEALTGCHVRSRFPVDAPAEGDWTGVPPHLVPILQRSLAFAPPDRWPDAAAFRKALVEAPHGTAVDVADPALEQIRGALTPEFDVERVLGVSQGIVVLAREVALGRRVAITAIAAELIAGADGERLRHDGQILADLSHRGILPHRVLMRSGFVFVVTAYLEGETLAQRIGRGPLAPEDVIRIGRDVLAALEAAHGRGLVHGGIHPGNVLLQPGRVVLAGFGIGWTVVKPRAAPKNDERFAVSRYAPPESLVEDGEPTPASDLYQVGMVLYEAFTGNYVRDRVPVEIPEAGEWGRAPRRLRGVLQRALAFSPSERWPDAASFRKALSTPGGIPVRPLAIVVAGVAVVAVVLWKPWIPRVPPALLADIAVDRLTGAPDAEASVADRLSLIVEEALHQYEGVTVGPPQQAAHRVEGRVVREGDDYVLHLQIHRSPGGPQPAEVRQGDSDLWRFGERAAVEIIGIVKPGTVPPAWQTECRPANVDALDAWLKGKEAFRRDDLGEAELQFQRSLAYDPDFCIPELRLWLVQRWRRESVTVNLRGLLDRHGARLPDADSLLLEAELATGRAQRRSLYLNAARRDPFEAYAPLQYGSELMHRGPLDGIPLDSSVVWLQEALNRDASLAPAHDQLVWALIRLGRRDEARSAVDALRRAARDPDQREVHPVLFEIVYAARFIPESLGPLLAGEQAGRTGELLSKARLGLAFDIAPFQAYLGRQLASRTGAAPSERALGHVARGLALIAAGRPNAGLAHLDTAAVLVPEYALQATQWKVLGSALDIPGIPRDTVARRRLAVLGSASPSADRRADWTLALDAMRGQDAAALSAAVARLARDTASRALWTMVVSIGVARSNAADALARTAALHGVAEEQNKLGDPFARAVLHLERAKWHRLLGDSASAERELRWHENADFEGWLDGPIQAAEVDWVVGTYVRYREGLRRVREGEKSACADLARVLDLWIHAEPAVETMAAEGHHAVAARCP